MTARIPAAPHAFAGQMGPLAHTGAQHPPAREARAAGPPVLGALESLAAVLDPSEHATALVTGDDRPPRLAVISRRTRLCEEICAAHGWFWWSWAERIAPINDPPAAAGAVSASLRAGRVPADRM